jgi:hypothetical protein
MMMMVVVVVVVVVVGWADCSSIGFRALVLLLHSMTWVVRGQFDKILYY